MRPTVVIADAIAESGVAALAEHCHVDVAVGVERSELKERIGEAAGLVVRSATTVDRELIEAGSCLRVIGRAGIGVDNIDVAAATERGVLVVNTPTANTISAAEHTMALLLSQARNIARGDQTLRSGLWDRHRFQGVELYGKTLGIVGLGRIGTLVAQRSAVFGMRVIAYDPYVTAERVQQVGVEPVDWETLLGESDFITIHLPKTAETTGLFNKDTLARCKPGVRLVNTSRGGIIDEYALVEAIRTGGVGGAALDVFEVEPLTDSPLFELPQVVLTPHLGASTTEAQDKTGQAVADAVLAALRGELVATAVNLDVGPEVSDEVRGFLPLAELLGRAFGGLSEGLSGRLLVGVHGRLAGHNLQSLKLAVLKGVLQEVTTGPVSYVNAPSLASARGISVDIESSEESDEYVSVIGLTGPDTDESISLAGTVTNKGAILVEVLGYDIELPVSANMLIVRNEDRPGVIGRVGTYLGDRGVNIANMVVGRSSSTGETAIMGLNLDQPLTVVDVDGLRLLDGIEQAQTLRL